MSHIPTNEEKIALLFDDNFKSWSVESLAWLGEQAAKITMADNPGLYIQTALNLKSSKKLEGHHDNNGVWYYPHGLEIAMRFDYNGDIYVDG